MPTPVLDVRNLRVQFQNQSQAAVAGISFTVERGQTLGIVGESGSGKSVSCLAAMGLVPSPAGQVQSGEIWFQGREMREPVNLLAVSAKQMQRYRGGDIGMIFQEPMTALNPVYSCGTQIVETLRQHERLSTAEAEKRAIALLQEVKLLPLGAALQPSRQVLAKYPHEFSGGQLQRLMIAMAMACNPSLLIADEPTTALDVTVQATILGLLKDLKTQRQMSLIFVSHDLGIIANVADQVAVMYQGEIVEVGPVAQVFRQPCHPYTKGLLACRPEPDRPWTLLPTVADFMQATTDTNGQLQLQEIQPDWSRYEQPRPAVALDTNPLLQVSHLSVTYPIRGALGGQLGQIAAVDDVSFEIRTGETLGLVGESGCGKSTLARALLRLLKPSRGEIWFAGQNLAKLSDLALRKLRRDLQIIFQDPYSALDPRMSIGDALLEPMLLHAYDKRKAAHRDRAVTLLERVGLDASALRRYPHEFSGGQRQRICIARALALNPRFIICDESVSALDVSVQAQVLNLLKDLQRDFSLTYLFISHDLSVVKFMSDRIMVMNQGRIEELGNPDEIYHNPQSDYTRKLVAAIPKVEVG